MNKILSIIAIGLLALGIYKTLDNAQVRNQQRFENRIISQINEQIKQNELKLALGAADTTKLIAGFAYTMSGSGVSSSATSFTLTSLTIPQNGYKIQDSDLSATFYVTIEPGNRTRQEVVSCTTVVQNAAGTATLSGCTRGLSPITPYTASSTLQFAHAGGTSVIFSDPPNVFNEFYALGNIATSTNYLVFSSTTPPHYDMSPTFANFASTTLADKRYVDSVVSAGASDADESTKGLVELATGAESASSTITGGTSARLVPSNTYATSSPYTTGSWAVWTMPNAKIKQAFLDLTEAFTWTGAHTFNSATTTIARLSLTSATTSISGIDFVFPNSQGTASSTLTNDGSGKLTWERKSGAIYSSIADVNVVSSTASSTLATFTVPANTLGTNGVLKTIVNINSLRLTNAQTVVFSAKYGTNAVGTRFGNGGGAPSGAGYGNILIEIIANGATNSQEMRIYVLQVDGSGNVVTAPITFANGATATATQDSTSAQTFLFEVKFSNSSTDDKINVDDVYSVIYR